MTIIPQTEAEAAPEAEAEAEAPWAGAIRHTPGPLSVGYYRPTQSFLSVIEHIAVMDEDKGLVALTGYSYTDQDPEIVARSIADARLFAAAPELLAALEFLVGALEHPEWTDRRGVMTRVPSALETARAALAKANGTAESETA